MSNVTITQLPYAAAITGTESVPIVQNGQTVQTTTAAIAASPSQFQTFLTLNQEPTLANSRALSTGAGLGLVDSGAQSVLRIELNGASESLENASNGVIVKTNSNTVVARTIQTTGSGIQITDGNGVAANPSISLTGLVQSLANSSGAGLLAMPNNGTVTPRAIAGTANQTTVTNGTGAVGNPTIAIASNPILPGTGSVTIPSGTTAQQPAGSGGQMRYDTDADAYLGYAAGSWRQFSLAGGVTLVNTGTGLTGGPITGSGTISLANTAVSAGSYGSATQIPQFTVNAQGQITAATNITVVAGIESVAGTPNEITATGTANVVLSLPSALTFTGKTVTDGTFNMAAATVGGDTVTTNTASQTITNKTINAANNTLSNIANASLTNSQITLGTTNIALGATALAPVGLTSVTVTQDPVSALQVATKQYVDTLVSSGITYHQPVKYEVPVTTGNLTATYNQPGGPGVGVNATLTNAGTLAAFAPDGPTASIGDRILIYSQTNAFENGVYTVTVVGSGATAWVLTRATDADTYALKSPTGLGQGDAFFVTSGNTGAGETYVLNTVGVIVFGSTSLTFAQISSAPTYSAGTGLTLTGTTFSIANTAVTAGAYGSASSVPTYTVNAQGQLTLAADTAIAIANTQVSGLGTMSTQAASSVAITGGSINGTAIGATTASTVGATTVTTNGAGSATTGAGQVYLNGATSNRIDFNTFGLGAPAFTTRSDGTKITLYPALSGSAVDYGIGVEAGSLWTSIPGNDGGQFFKWYGATTQVASLSGTGVFVATGGISGGTF